MHNGRCGGVRGGGCGVLCGNEKESLAFGGLLLYSRGPGRDSGMAPMGRAARDFYPALKTFIFRGFRCSFLFL